MARNSIDVAVNCDLTVSRETAEVCLKLIEYFIKYCPSCGARLYREGETE